VLFDIDTAARVSLLRGATVSTNKQFQLYNSDVMRNK